MRVLKSSSHFLWLALSFQTKPPSMGEAVNLLLALVNGGILVSLHVLGRWLQSGGAEMESELLPWVLPLSGALVLFVIAGTRLHMQSVPRLRLGRIRLEPGHDSTVWTLHVFNDGNREARACTANLENLHAEDGSKPKSLLRPLNWPNHGTKASIQGGLSERLDLVHLDLSTVFKSVVEGEKVTVKVPHRTVCHSGSYDPFGTILPESGRLFAFVSLGSQDAGPLFIRFDIDLNAMEENPDGAVTIGDVQAKRPARWAD